MSSTEVVPDPLVLAALDRAERHSNHDRGGVMVATLYDHLGVRKASAAARRVREQVGVLVEAGSVERARRNGVAVVVLTAAGRRRLAQTQRAGKIPELPESPQHRKWREAHDRAEVEVERFVQQAQEAIEEAVDLLDGLAGLTPHRPTSEALLASRERLHGAMFLAASATYCVYEWPEPDDAKRDDGSGVRGLTNVTRWAAD
ncbi:MAG: hypothetical protein ACLPUT_18505 [Solirubrobacteraceae bacterium]